MKDLLIIVPAYNEEDNIEAVLETLEQPDIRDIADVLIMNDASADNTNRLVKFRNHTMVTHVFNLGYGSAIQLGYKYAVRRKYQYVIQMDADGQHDICNIKNIYRELKRADEKGEVPDIVLGSRFMGGGNQFQVRGIKLFAIRLFRFMIKSFTGVKILDPTSGLQGLNRKAFLYYSKYQHFDDKYPDANMITQMLLLKFKIREIPSVMHARGGGVTMHAGLKPLMYMIRMFLDVIMVAIRFGVMKVDAGIGENDTVWKDEV